MRFRDHCLTGTWPALIGAALYIVAASLIFAPGHSFGLELDLPSLFPVLVIVLGPVALGLLLRLASPATDRTGFTKTLPVPGETMHGTAWGACLYFGLAYGGFVGLTGYLHVFFRDRYGLDNMQAGTATALIVLAASLLQPVGGYVASRFGSGQVLTILLFAAAALFLDLATSPPLLWTTLLLMLVLGLLALASGAFMQSVRTRFSLGPDSPFLIGLAGGLGGVLLLGALATAGHFTGSFSLAHVLFSMIALAGAIALLNVSPSWARIVETGEDRTAAEAVSLESK